MRTLLRRVTTVMAALAMLLCNGCFSSGGTKTAQKEQQAEAQQRLQSALAFKKSPAKEKRQVSIQELDQLTYGYADRYNTLISAAVEAIKRGNTNPAQRRRAHQIMLNGIQAMNDIVSGSDPYSDTLDLVVSVTLQSILLIDEDRAEEVFGDRSPILIKAIRTMRVEAWDLAAKVLTQEELELLDYIVLEWRRLHPEVEQVAFVKFDNFASARALQLLSEFKAGGGFLAPLNEASLVLKDWGRLTERAFWYSKRAPNLAAIQAEGAVNEILSAPEIEAMIQTADRLGKSAEAVPQTIDNERKALFADLDARQTLLTNTLSDVRRIVTEANALGRTTSLLATNLQQTLQVLGDTLQVAGNVSLRLHLDQFLTNEPARPFDIQDYTAMLSRFNDIVTNLQQLSLDADQLTRSEGWKKALQDLTDVTDRRMDRAFNRLCLVVGLAFLLAIAYRIISLKLTARLTPGGDQKP